MNSLWFTDRLQPQEEAPCSAQREPDTEEAEPAPGSTPARLQQRGEGIFLPWMPQVTLDLASSGNGLIWAKMETS